MPNHNDDPTLFAECLQAEATYGTLLPCEQFAPLAWHEPDRDAACLPVGAGRGVQHLFGGN